jgi:hypothetical protein
LDAASAAPIGGMRKGGFSEVLCNPSCREEGAFLGRAQGIVVHASAPDVATGFAGQGIVDGGILIFHLYIMKDITFRNRLQGKKQQYLSGRLLEAGFAAAVYVKPTLLSGAVFRQSHWNRSHGRDTRAAADYGTLVNASSRGLLGRSGI